MIKRSLRHWLIGIIAVVVAVVLAKAIGLKLYWPSPLGMVVFVPVLALVNAVVGPIIRLFSMPITCLTLGLFGIVINALVFWIAGAATGAQMTFLSALFGSVVVAFVGGALSRAIKEK